MNMSTFQVNSLKQCLRILAARLKVLPLISVMSCFALSHPLQAQTVSMTTTNWAPFYAESLDQGGFISAIVSASLKASGYDSTLEFTGWKEALEEVKAGKKDIVVGAYFSEERAQYYHYSLPIYSVLTGVFKKTGHELNFYTSFDTLDQYKLGKLDQTVVAKSFDAYPFKSLTRFEQVSDGLNALEQGNIDLYVESYAVAKQVASDMGMDATQLEMIQPPIEENELHIMISKSITNATQLRDAFNAGFVEIQINGTYDKILKSFNQM